MSREWTELDELMLRRASDDLSAEDRARLDALLEEASEEDRDWLDLLVGELDAEISAVEGEEALPVALRERVLADALASESVSEGGHPHLSLHHDASRPESVGTTPQGSETSDGVRGSASATASPPASPPRSFGIWSGWAAAAAILVIWLGPGRNATRSASDGLDAPPSDPLAAILAIADQPDAQRQTWTATEDPTASGLAGGEVVWSPSTQSGFMRFSGLASNNPTEFQYQLWIFDAERDERFPVDGGVFDIPVDGSDVVIPIDARLPVGEVTLFAVTVEPPGGVVVSDRSRIAVVAQLD